ncbi:MAG: phage tail tape measure protein [Coprococcus sp.]
MKVTECTNRNSVAMQDMAEATKEAGSMAAQSGVKVNELSALIGTAVARTKKSGNEIGTALKALFINLQNTQNEKITGTFDKLGISMTKIVGDSEMLKTPIELIEELSKVYNALPEGSVDKANILTNIGGKVYLVVQKCTTRMNLIAGNV